MASKWLTAAALAALALRVGTADAQAGVGISAGLSAARGDFGDIVDNGYHVTGIIALGGRSAPAGLRLEGTFSEFNYKGILGSTDAKARLLYGTANIVLAKSGDAGPYVIGGFGVYRATAECDLCSASSTKGGVNGGVGFRWGLSGFSAFLEARYHYIAGASDPTNGGDNTSNTTFIPISFGVRF
jgi:hypothetical protein